MGRTSSRGIEVESDVRLSNGMRGRLGYTLQSTEDEDSGAKLTNSPRHLLELNWLSLLFDQQYADFGDESYLQDVIPQDGRLYRLKLTKKC